MRIYTADGLHTADIGDSVLFKYEIFRFSLLGHISVEVAGFIDEIGPGYVRIEFGGNPSSKVYKSSRITDMKSPPMFLRTRNVILDRDYSETTK